MTQESDVYKVDIMACANDSMYWIYNRSCCKLVYTLTIVTGCFFGGPILGLFLNPFLRVQKWGKIGVDARFSDIEKLSMLLYDILTTTTCWWCCYHNTHAASENAKSGVRGRKKIGWQSTVDPAISGGPVEGRRMSRGVQNSVLTGPQGTLKISLTLSICKVV